MANKSKLASISSATAAALGLQTRDQILAELSREIEQDTLTVVARRYRITPQQLSDIRLGRANLSKKALAKLQIELVEYYRRLAKKETV